MRTAYRKVFGRLPEVGPAHPYWIDLHPVVERLRAAAGSASSALAVTGNLSAMVSPRLEEWVPRVDHLSYADCLDEQMFTNTLKGAPYDLCWLEIRRDELLEFGKLHARLRGVIRKGGTVLVFCRLGLHDYGTIKARDFSIIQKALPTCDVAELRFAGGPMLHRLQVIWQRQIESIAGGRLAALCRLALTGLLIAPVAAIANWCAARRPVGRLPKDCTSVVLEITVV